MSETIPVIREAEAKDEAEAMGYRKFEDVEPELAEDVDPAGISDSAWFANHLLPRLRCMAGFEDNVGGTYNVSREVALIPTGCEDDRPSEAERLDSDDVYRELVDCWYEGAYRALDDAREGGE